MPATEVVFYGDDDGTSPAHEAPGGTADERATQAVGEMPNARRVIESTSRCLA
jgi:hypothetical protein